MGACGGFGSLAMRFLSASTKVDLGLLSQLRRETQGSMQACRQALAESDNNIAKARVRLAALLQGKGLVKLAQVAGASEVDQAERLNEGLVSSFSDESGTKLCAFKIACRTDFASRSDIFAKLAADIGRGFLSNDPDCPSASIDMPQINQAVAILQEPIVLSDVHVWHRLHRSHPIGTYLHNKSNSNGGTIWSFVRMVPSSTAGSESGDQSLSGGTQVRSFVENLARHIAGMAPGTLEELLGQEFMFSDSQQTVGQAIASSRPLANFSIAEFARISIK